MAYSGTGAEGRFGDNPNPAGAIALDQASQPKAVELSRINHALQARYDQIETNIMGLAGGRDYVRRRLSRFSGECKIDWEGGRRADGVMVTGRRQQSHSFPYLRRIADKISQYVFSQCPSRDGIDEQFEVDASSDGRSLNLLMKQVNDYLTACGWCWIGIDSPPLDKQVSVAEKKAKKLRPYWEIYSPLSVKDWKFDGRGGIEWLITEGNQIEAGDVTQPEQDFRVRRIWTPGEVRTVKMKLERNEWRVKSDETRKLSFPGVPFVLVGHITTGGHPFDDIESINRTIMDLESVNRANFFKRCYPQTVLPESCIRNMADTYKMSAGSASDLIVGMNYPILISKDDPSPFYLMPSGSDMAAIRNELESLKRNMFESVGLLLANESRQVASAESKAWDFLDVAQVMMARADLLEDAELKAAQMTNAWDNTVSEWTPVYNRDFDVGDFQQEINALVMAANVPMPKEATRIVLQKLIDRVDRVGASLTDDQRRVVQDAIEEFDPTALSMGPGMFGDT